MSRVRVSVVALSIVVMSTLAAAETPVIDPAKAAQLQRLEPLTAEKVDVFVEAGKLSAQQAEYVKKHIGPNGQLALPEAAIAPEQARTAARLGSDDPYAEFNYTLNEHDREYLNKLILDYRYGNRDDIGRELHKFMPQVNQIVAAAFKDPIDIFIKKQLWRPISGRANPEAAYGLSQLHRETVQLAHAVLIPYDKDVGGVMVRRHIQGPGDPYPQEKFFPSRDLRNLIEDLEGYISLCAGPAAATYLMDVYSHRYGSGEAPMRDVRRDRHRMVDACGGAGAKKLGDRKRFDEDVTDTWTTTLSQHDRALIADKLIPWLNRSNDDRRQIAKDGLMICLPGGHPSWKAGEAAWDAWWSAHKDELLNSTK